MGQHITEKSIVIGQNTVSYYDNGSGEITLLFIHGAFINKDYWKDQISFFSDKCRVIAIDLPGHGKSTSFGNDWTIAQYGHAVSELISKLSLDNIILVGHSIGADVMLETVLQSRKHILGVVAVDYFKNVGVELPAEMIDPIMTGLKTDFANTTAYYVRQSLITDETDQAIAQKILADFVNANPKMGIPLNEDAFHYTKRETELLKNLKLTLYLINVDYFPTNAHNLQKYLGDSYQLTTLHGTCHYPMLESPKEFDTVLLKVMKEISDK